MQIGADGWSGRKSPADTVLPSMSTLAGVGSDWSAYVQKSLAEGVAMNIGRLSTMTDDSEIIDEVEGYRWGARDASKMSASQRGTFLHDTLECWMYGEHGPEVTRRFAEQLQPYINNLGDWMKRNEPKLIAAEEAVFNEEVGAAGRYDLYATFGAGPFEGRTALLDLKTKDRDTTARGYPTRPYADQVALQLAGYRWSEYQFPFKPRTQENNDRYGGRVYLMNSEEREQVMGQQVPWFDDREDLMTAVIFLTPSRCSTYEVETGRDTLEYMIDHAGVWQWSKLACKEDGRVGEEQP